MRLNVAVRRALHCYPVRPTLVYQRRQPDTLDEIAQSSESHRPVYSGSTAIYLDVHSLSQPTARHLTSLI